MAAAGVSAAFDFGFNRPTTPFDGQCSAVSHFTPPRRPDTPQLTLHDYRKFQHSPQLSSSPELDYKRVRRKASVANLAASPQSAPFAWTPNCAPPTFYHSFAPHDLAPSFLPPPPATPQARATASPSLSSTVTTLLSTPTHTPVWRGGSSFEQRRVVERSAPVEPLRSKRKFPSLKQAKRLPRRVDSGSGSGDGGIWEVYAAILDPPEQEVQEDDAAQVTSHAVEAGEQQQQQQQTGASKHQTNKYKQTRFLVGSESVQALNTVAPEDSEGSLRVNEETGPLPTSSFSLSKFEFPVPPGQDNWGCALGHLTAPSSPQSPATFHLHGASFDLVNPHASLLLGAHQFETPAEIDGLLDDYFDNPSEEDEMSDPKLPWSPSVASLGAASDSSRHTTRLYDDAASARRNILRVDEEVPPPPKVFVSDSPLSYKSQQLPFADAGPRSAPLPYRSGQDKQHTGLFGNVSAFGGALTWGGRELERNSPARLEEGVARSDVGPAPTKSTLSVGASRLVRTFSRRKARSHASDPFDLTLSDEGNGSRPNIFNALAGHRAENEPTDQRKVDQVDSLAPDGASSQASSPEQDTDPTLKEILNGYEYTRVEPNSPMDDGWDSSSVEIGRRTAGLLGVPLPRQMKMLSPPTEPLPTPPAPTYSPQRYSFGPYELLTSEQTYGETNELLQITPDLDRRYLPTRAESQRLVQTSPLPGNIQVHEDTQAPHDSADSKDYYHDNKENRTPTLSDISEASQETARGLPHGIDDDIAVLRESRQFGVLHEGHGILDRNQVRVSSILSTDDDNDWETDSQPAFQQGERPFSIGSYADTSNDGTNRLSVGPEALRIPPAALRSPRFDEKQDQWSRDRRFAFQVDDESIDTKKAISLLSDKIVTDKAPTKLCGEQDDDREQRMLNLLELERLRRRNPKAVRDASSQIADKAGEYLSKMFKAETDGKPQAMFSPKKESRNSLIQGIKSRGKMKVSTDPASDRRALLAESPGPGVENTLRYDPSLDTFVTVRDSPEGPHPGKPWSPYGTDPTMHALRSGSPLPTTEDILSGRRGALDIPRSNGKNKRTSRIFTGNNSKPVELRLLKPVGKTSEWRPLTDDELADRMPNWQKSPNLGPDGALANYAMREEVRRDGPVYPSLPITRFFSEDKNFNPAYSAERENISKLVGLQCCWFPPLSLAYAMGLFDYVIERKTAGRIKKMAPRQKLWALKVHLPLGLIGWAVLIIMIVAMVEIFKVYGDNGNSAPVS